MSHRSIRHFKAFSLLPALLFVAVSACRRAPDDAVGAATRQPDRPSVARDTQPPVIRSVCYRRVGCIAPPRPTYSLVLRDDNTYSYTGVDGVAVLGQHSGSFRFAPFAAWLQSQPTLIAGRAGEDGSVDAGAVFVTIELAGQATPATIEYAFPVRRSDLWAFQAVIDGIVFQITLPPGA